MKKKLAAFLAMMMALVTMSSAAMAEEEKPTITAHKANAITIDGDLSDWDLSSPAVLEDASQIIRDLSFWQGPNDLSAKVYAAYDEENLYLAFDVTEDTLRRYRDAAAGWRRQPEGLHLHRSHG